MSQIDPTFEVERRYWNRGLGTVAGVDEAGRGALAGPVVAAAVILDPDCSLPGVRDSKLLSEARREVLYDDILNAAVAWGVGLIDNVTIDSINILQATFRAMAGAVSALSVVPDAVIVDGRDRIDVAIPCQAVIGGDRLSRSIAAASIIAKVTRDRIMRSADVYHPNYQFARNKGYGTELHRDAIRAFGPSSLHRITFLGRVLAQPLASNDIAQPM